MSDNDDKISTETERTPPPVAVSDLSQVPARPGRAGADDLRAEAKSGIEADGKDRRRRRRGRVISIDEAEALAAWDKAAAFAGDDDRPDTEEPPAPDAADLVLDVTADEDRTLVSAEPGAAGPGSVFTRPLRAEPVAVAIDAGLLGFRPAASDFRPHAIAQALAADLHVEVADVARATEARRAQLHLLADELNLLAAADVGSAEVARAAGAAARAAEAIGSEEALRFYQQALAADPGFAPALRGRLRLLWRAGQIEEAMAIATALVDALPSDADAYRAVLAEVTNDVLGGEAGAASVAAQMPPLVTALFAFERSLRSALQGGDRSVVIDPAERLAEQVGGDAASALRGFASATRQLGSSSASRSAADAPPATVAESPWAELRRALHLPPDRALDLVVKAAAALPSSPLSPGLWRWAARLSRRIGDRAQAQQLLQKARAGGAAFLAHESVDLASDDVRGDQIPAVADLLDRLAGVPADTVAALADRFAAALLNAGRVDDALAIVERACQQDPGAGAALAATLSNITVASSPAPASVTGAARTLLAEIDPSRRSELRLANTLAALVRPDRRAEILSQLAQSAAQLDPIIDRPGVPSDPALAWWLAWQFRAHDRAEAAAEAVAAAVDRWIERSPALAGALQARAAVLTAASDIKGFAAALPVNRFAEPSPDDPADLVREMIAPGRDARTIATRFHNAAKAAEACRFRIHEAIGWSVQAGEFAEALAVLHAAPTTARTNALGRQLLRRLARLGDDHHVAETLLRELGGASEDPRARALYHHLAAEILERTGQRPAAAALYRELLAGPLAKDADLGLRRALFVLRDGAALMDFWRDEFDACSGAGRDRAAADAAVEKARVALDLFDDRAVGADEIAAALALEPDLLSARVLSLCHVPGLGGWQQRQVQLERLIKDMPGQEAAIAFFAALMADGEGEGEAALKLLEAAVAAVDGSAPLALMRRYVAVIERRGNRQADFAGVLAAAADRLVHTSGADPRLTTTVFLRAAEVAAQTGDRARAETLTERAKTLSPDDLPALVRLARLQLDRGDFSAALRHLEAQAAALRDPARKTATWFMAAGIAADQLGDDARARPLLSKVLDLDPAHEGAFARLRKMLGVGGDAAALAALLGRRAQAIGTAGPDRIKEAAALRVERAQLLAGKLGDRSGAKTELGEALALDPDNLVALETLATLEIEDRAAPQAIELTLRQSQLETDPGRQIECFLRLGRLYREIADPPSAVSAYENVLEIEPGNREALAALSDLYANHGEARRGILVTERLLEPETDPMRRLPLLLRLAALWEASGDVRRAGVCLRHAAEAAPRDLQTLAELVRFHDRQKDPAGRNLPLDGAIALLREDFRAGRDPAQALRTLVPLLRWRKRPAGALAAAQLLGRLAADPTTRAESTAAVHALLADRQTPPSLKEIADDDRMMPHAVPPGLPHVLRTLGPALARINKPDLRRYDVGRGDRQGRSSAIRTAFDPLAVELAVRDFDAYVASRQSHALAVEPGDPPAFIVGAGIATKGPVALRFVAGYCLRLYQSHFAFILRDGPIEAAALIAGLVRQFLPDHRPPYLPEAALKIADARVAKALNRSLRNELSPLASQLAAGTSPEELFTAAHEVGARAGLIACGDLLAALDVLAAFAGRPDASLPALMELPLVAHLIDFALSEEHDALLAADQASDVAPA
jgi:tetratricopeptide (TPR) repeat protein/plasmid stabilization system protein ParE